MKSPNFSTENLGIMKMKNKDLAFYGISAFSLCLFVFLPLAVGFSVGEEFPGTTFLQEWIETGDQFALSKNQDSIDQLFDHGCS